MTASVHYRQPNTYIILYNIYNIVVAQSLNIGVCLNTVLKQEAKGQF